jgi:hypothetical protein
MSTIGVYPENDSRNRVFRAVSGKRAAIGPTIGDAFKSLADEMGEPEETTLVVIQPMKPDRFFTAEQIGRLGELMAKSRVAWSSGKRLDDREEKELDDLVQAELVGMMERTKALFGDRLP